MNPGPDRIDIRAQRDFHMRINSWPCLAFSGDISVI